MSRLAGNGSALFQGVAMLAVLAALMAAPVMGLSNYTITQMALLFIWACVVVQWNLVFGVAGIMTFGQIAAFAVGGYTTVFLSLYLHVPFVVSVVLAAPAAMLFNFMLGVITLRMRGEYVAVVTFAVAMLLAAAVEADISCYREIDGVCYAFSGGMRGLSGFGDFGWAKILGFSHRYMGDYYLALGLLTFSFLLALMISMGPFGLAFRAIRDNELYARSRGVAFRKYQLIVFALSGIATGLAGGVYAGVVKTVGPTLLDMDLLVFLLSMLVVGGRGSTWGPLLGSALLMWADSVLQSYGAWRTGGLGLVTVLFVIVYPRGVAGALTSLWSYARRFTAAARATHPARAGEPVKAGGGR